MAKPRLFLVAPQSRGADAIFACVKAAVAAGDVASVVLYPEDLRLTAKLQDLGLAILADRDTSLVLQQGCDGAHINAETDDVEQALSDLGDGLIVGAYCGASRDLAMRAAEAGASYIAFSQNAKAPLEPILGWWSDLFEVPCVAYDPVTPEDLTILLSQRPDFIRPSDEMWQSPDQARLIISELMKQLV